MKLDFSSLAIISDILTHQSQWWRQLGICLACLAPNYHRSHPSWWRSSPHTPYSKRVACLCPSHINACSCDWLQLCHHPLNWTHISLEPLWHTFAATPCTSYQEASPFLCFDFTSSSGALWCSWTLCRVQPSLGQPRWVTFWPQMIFHFWLSKLNQGLSLEC